MTAEYGKMSSVVWGQDARALALQARVLSGPKLDQLVRRLQPFLLNPGMDLGFPDAKNSGQRFDRKTIASNVSHLQAVPAQCAAYRIRASTEHSRSFFY